MRRGLGGMLLALMLGAPAVAQAGTAFYDPHEIRIHYKAAPGEQNTVIWADRNRGPLVSYDLEIVDATAPVAATGTSCALRAPHVARCDPSRSVVTLGDGDDRLVVASSGRYGSQFTSWWESGMRIDAGPGDDYIEAGREDVVLIEAGPGADRIVYGGTGGRLDAGEGDDRVSLVNGVVDHGERLTLLCGPGNDTLIAERQDVVDPTDCETITRVG